MSAATVVLAVTWVAICAIFAVNKIIDGVVRDVEDHEG